MLRGLTLMLMLVFTVQAVLPDGLYARDEKQKKKKRDSDDPLKGKIREKKKNEEQKDEGRDDATKAEGEEPDAGKKRSEPEKAAKEATETIRGILCVSRDNKGDVSRATVRHNDKIYTLVLDDEGKAFAKKMAHRRVEIEGVATPHTYSTSFKLKSAKDVVERFEGTVEVEKQKDGTECVRLVLADKTVYNISGDVRCAELRKLAGKTVWVEANVAELDVASDKAVNSPTEVSTYWLQVKKFGEPEKKE